MASIFKAKNIHKWYGRIHALKGIDFTINSSEIVGLIGENGAGKSTLIKIFSGVFPPDKGELFFKEKKINFHSPKDSRKCGIETIYQEQALAYDLSIVRNIFLGRELKKSIGPIKLLDMKKMEEESRKILINIGLNIPLVKEKVMFCSGGEAQSVAIARTIYFQADLVILDEPTRALGVTEVKRILDLISKMKRRGSAVLFVSHNIHHIFFIADKFVVLDRGVKIREIQKKKTSVGELVSIMERGSS